MRAIASVNPSAGLSGLTTTELRARRQMSIADFFNKKQRATYTSYFDGLQEKQRKRAVEMFEKLIDDADNFDFAKFTDYLLKDGKLSESEKVHLRIVQSIYSNRVQQLKNSAQLFKQLLGLLPK
jgi:hypothetical protein